MLTLVVFGLAIVSSFAMETDPPTEPVKTTVETEVIEEVQPLISYGYIDASSNCVYLGILPSSSDCLPSNNGDVCTEIIDLLSRDLYEMHFNNVTQKWNCGEILQKP